MATDTLPDELSRFALATPLDLVERLADNLLQHGQQRALAAIPQPAIQAQARTLFLLWEQQAPHQSPAGLAFALRTAAHTAQTARQQQQTALVWTGPEVGGVSLRRTDQALLEVIEAARQRLLIVSFAVYHIPRIKAALLAAAQRGVQLDLCLESPTAVEDKIGFDPRQALGEAVARHAAFYVWPTEQRLRDERGRHGSLHAKCAVADERLLFISSANLTGYALSLNMELGILIEGGEQPRQVNRIFQGLMEGGVLVRKEG